MRNTRPEEPQVTRTMTQEEYDVWCWTTEERTEFVDGQVIVMSPESTRDDGARGWLGSVLRYFVEDTNLGEVLGPNVQIRPIAGRRRIPDLLFVHRLNRAKVKQAYIDGAPDLAVEFISKDSVKRDREDKFAEYLTAGVREYWLIHIPTRCFEAYRLTPSGYQPIEQVAGVLRSAVIEGFWFRPEWLWSDPMPTISSVVRELGL